MSNSLHVDAHLDDVFPGLRLAHPRLAPPGGRMHHGGTAIGIELDQPAGMHAEPRARRHAPLRRADQRVDASRVAGGERVEVGRQRLARPLQGVAGFLVEPPARLRLGARDARRHAALAHHPADAEGTIGKSAGGMEIDRQVRIALLGQERPQPRRSAGVERAFGGDPFAASGPAGVRRALGAG